MDYYQLLRVSSSASKKEIEDAYQRLIKEANYDSSIDTVLVGTAYRILSDPRQRSAYDSIKLKRERGSAAYAATMKRRKVPVEWNRNKLIGLVLLLFLIAAVYYGFRFGHVFKNFEVGDTLYLSDTNEKLGTIVKIEHHNFGNIQEPAYLIQGADGMTWYPEAEVKIRCYKSRPN
jgi:curved DNA-binding protein CbpA